MGLKDQPTRIDSTSKKVPRPPNAFILYRQQIQPELVEMHQGQSMSSRDYSYMVGQMWRCERKSVKEVYQKQAAEKLRLHRLLYPEYRYCPHGRGKGGKKVFRKRGQSQNLAGTSKCDILQSLEADMETRGVDVLTDGSSSCQSTSRESSVSSTDSIWSFQAQMNHFVQEFGAGYCPTPGAFDVDTLSCYSLGSSVTSLDLESLSSFGTLSTNLPFESPAASPSFGLQGSPLVNDSLFYVNGQLKGISLDQQSPTAFPSTQTKTLRREIDAENFLQSILFDQPASTAPIPAGEQRESTKPPRKHSLLRLDTCASSTAPQDDLWLSSAKMLSPVAFLQESPSNATPKVSVPATPKALLFPSFHQSH